MSNNVLEFAIDLWENYLIYNIEELWERCKDTYMKPYHTIKEKYLEILDELKDQLSISYIALPGTVIKFQYFVFNLVNEMGEFDYSREFVYFEDEDMFDAKKRKSEPFLKDIFEYMMSMGIIPRLKENFDAPENPFYEAREVVKDFQSFIIANKDIIKATMLNTLSRSLEEEPMIDEVYEYHKIDQKRIQEIENKLKQFNRKFSEYRMGIIPTFDDLSMLNTLIFLQKGSKEKKVSVIKKIKKIMDETVRFELQSKSLIDTLILKHKCEDFVNEYKNYNVKRHVHDYSIWNFVKIIHDLILSKHGTSKINLCHKILHFDNIKREHYWELKPYELIFYYPDDKFYEKTPYLYKKETIEEVSNLLSRKIDLKG